MAAPLHLVSIGCFAGWIYDAGLTRLAGESGRRETGPGTTQPTTNGDGTRIFFRSSANLTGENADENSERFLFDATTGQFTQVTRTTAPSSGGRAAAMSGSGTRIVFDSNGNFSGENPDGNSELFLFDSTTGAFTQITHHTVGLVFQPKISDNGARIAFDGTADWAGENPDGNQEVFVFETMTGILARVMRAPRVPRPPPARWTPRAA